jgi:hypothetical protein
MEQGFKSSCEGDQACIQKIEQHIDECLHDDDLDTLIKTPDSEYDDKALEIGVKAVQCIQSQ